MNINTSTVINNIVTFEPLYNRSQIPGCTWDEGIVGVMGVCSTGPDPRSGFHTGIFIGEGGGEQHIEAPAHTSPQERKGILETSEIAFQAYFDQKLMLTD